MSIGLFCRGPDGHCLGLFCIYNFFTKKKTVQVADAHAHVKRLVSVVNMETVLEECTTEQQRSVVRFFVGKRTQCKVYSYS
jgi:hypothetical protein